MKIDMKSSQEIQAQIDELQKKKNAALKREQEALAKKRKAFESKLEKHFKNNMPHSFKDYEEEMYYDIKSELKEVAYDYSFKVFDWDVENVINPKIEILEETIEITKTFIEGLKGLRDDLMKEFK
jgi:ABC-type phosphate transport system auxiliary subunit